MRLVLGLVCVVLVGCGSPGTSDAGTSAADAGSLWPVGASKLAVYSANGYPSCISETWTLTFGGQLEFTKNTLASASDPYGACVAKTGSKALNQGDLDRLEAAMKALTRPASPQCDVSDGPQLSAELTTPTDTRRYREAGLGCSTLDQSTTVSGLQPVLDSLRAWAP
jgi:hypothetical protein